MAPVHQPVRDRASRTTLAFHRTYPPPSLPHPAEVAKVLLSPRGDHLVWLVTDGTAYSPHGQIWLSDSHGKQMQRLYRIRDYPHRYLKRVRERTAVHPPHGRNISVVSAG